MLVVGGGANGVEMASEMKEGGLFKKVGLLTRGPRLLSDMPQAASQAAEAYMRE